VDERRFGRNQVSESITVKLDDLCELFESRRFPALGEPAHPDRGAVVDARSATANAVVDDEFLADCLALELRRIRENRLLLGFGPFFIMPGAGVRFAFGLWRPGGTPGPHEHTAWTITAVCRNELDVLVYDREESYRRRELIPKNQFAATSGQVGFIYDPCIHEPKNSSRDWSLSLHISSPRDGEPLNDHVEPVPTVLTLDELNQDEIEHPYTHVQVERERLTAAHQLARILATMDVPQAPELLGQCYEMASSATRRWLDRKVRKSGAGQTSDVSWILTRTHPDLAIRPRRDGERIALEVETADGPLDEFALSDEACAAQAAIEFIAREPTFDVRSLPGNLTWEEQLALGEGLEETGLFTRVSP
jgi:hypothetical protein